MTLFEKIARREIPAAIVYEDGEIVAFKDIDPQAPVHIVITPKRVIPTTNDLVGSDAPLVGRMVLVGAQLAKEQGIAEGGYRLVFNCNRDAGQSVDHIHLHLLGGRKLSWPPG